MSTLPGSFVALLVSVIALRPQDGEKPPVPDPAAQKDAEKVIRDIFKEEFARPGIADRKSLARRLIQDGRDPKNEAPLRFVLLRESRDLATQAGDLETAFESIDATAAGFAVDPLGLKLGVVSAASSVLRNAEQVKSLAEACIRLSEEAAGRGDLNVAAKAAEAGIQAARKAKDVPLVGRAEARGKAVAELKAAHEKVRKCLELLDTKPDDPEANLVAGKYHCFTVKNWEKGLACLAKGADPAFKDLASKELSNSSAEDEVKTGDGWWDAGDRETTYKPACRDRAQSWYRKAWPGLKGLSREKVRARFRTAAGVPAALKPGGTPVGWSMSVGGTALDTSFAHAGKHSIRVAAADPPRHHYFPVEAPRRPATPGQKYTLSAWVFCDGNAGPRDDLFLRLFAPSSAFAGQPGAPLPLDRPFWTFITETITIPEGIGFLDISVQMRSTSGVIWIDDVSLTLDGKELLVNGSFEQTGK